MWDEISLFVLERYSLLLQPMDMNYIHIMYVASRGRLNKKDDLTRHGDSHVKDKTS